MADPWAEFSDAAPAGDPWGEFQDAPAIGTRASVPIVPNVRIPFRLTGRVHDGDTVGLTGGFNGRLSGVDAFELNQTGRNRAGQPVPIGMQSRDYLLRNITPNVPVIDTGTRSYNRPVIMLNNGGVDVGQNIISSGNGMAAPNYLKGDPRLTPYMEAERLARLNRRGAFATQFQSPSDFRHKIPDPWAKAQASTDGKGNAVFFDDRTPFQGLRPHIAKGYIALAKDPKSTASDLVNYAKANGAMLSMDRAEKFIKQRNAGAIVSDQIEYEQLPQVLTNQGDGRLGAFGRGFADPINMLDELGGVADALGGTQGRENILTSDRRFGDILWNNIDQNRSVLAYDDTNYPYFRFSGQLASGLIAPGASVEGVGFNAARSAIRAGATRFAAADLAKAAVRRRLMTAGAIEGGLAGAGAGEGGPVERAPSAAIGATLGAGFGYGTAALGQKALPLVRRFARGRAGQVSDNIGQLPPTPKGDEWAEFADAAHSIENNQTKSSLPTPEGFREQPAHPREGSAAMDSEITPAGISAPARVPDRIDVWSEFADAPSGAIDDPVLGRVRPLTDQASPAQMAATANRVFPEGMTPIPRNEIESLDEAMRANPGSVRPLPAPDERAALPSYRPSPNLPARRDPMDLVSFLRSQGGIRDQGGELSHMGISNKPRDMEFAKSEGFLGKLVDGDKGMTLDDAARAAWEQGYFPDHAERPTVAEFLDAVGGTYRGGAGRVFHPDDFNSIDAYRGAQAQRLAVEKAEAEGSPLAERVGQPATLDDLDANQPPATAYEDLPRVGGKAGNIVLDKLESKEDIQRALMNTDAVVGGFDAARRGKVSHAETEALARELGMTADDLLRRRKGQALNAEQALAARSILAKSGDELVALARKSVGGSDEDLASFRRAWLRHVAIQEQVSGATAEAGRALSQFRMSADSRLPRGHILKDMLDNAGGRDKLEEAARSIIDLQKQGVGPDKINQYAAKSLTPKWRDKAIEWYYNSLLSNVPTHVVNVLSNGMTAALQIPEFATASAIGAARRAVRLGDVDRVLGSEVGARAIGLMQGAREGLDAFARTMRTGNTLDPATQVESSIKEAIPGTLGQIVRTPTRLLAAEDELFKAVGRRSALNGLAVRQAAREGLKGDAFKKRVADLSNNPTDEIFEESLDYARYLTFQRPLGPIMRGISHITNQSLILKTIAPFVRTPTNILSYAAERSPIAFAAKPWRQDFAAGGARRDLAVAKVMLGTGLGMLVAQWAADGRITGAAPRDRGQADLLRADGWQPYSIKVGDKYISYARMDPIATTFGTAADLAQAAATAKDADLQEATDAFALAIIDQIDSKTLLDGISNVMKVVDPRGQGSISDRVSAYAGRQVGSFVVPAIVAQAARTTDPLRRDPKGFLQTIQGRVPLLSRKLPARVDVWGSPVLNEGAIGPDTVSPYLTTQRRNEPLNAALLSAGISINDPNRRVGGRRLTNDEFREYKAKSGQILRGLLAPYVMSPEWTDLSAEDKKKVVQRSARDSRATARAGLFGGGKP
jgi:endonuclease YncB( thermonuclease family)